MTKLVFDIDFIIFEAVSVAEERYITARHKPTGKEMEFATKTELWGHHLKKTGGWIGTQNEVSGDDFYKAEDFEVVECHRPRPFKIKGIDGNPDYFIDPIDGAKKILDDKVRLINNKLMAEDYCGYTGEGEVFRHEVATLMPYKGNRDDLLTPFLLKEMKQHTISNHNIELVTGIEADDAVSMAVLDGYNRWIEHGMDDDYKVIGIAVDKDSKQTTGWWFNPNKDKAPRLVTPFGGLWLDEKGKVDGMGRCWLYFQMCVGDSADNYKANSHSSIKWADMGGYNALKDCTNDKEAWTALVAVFKKLYPEKKVVTTFRGDVEIDHMYVLQEMATLAMMLRKPGDKIDVRAVCDKLGVAYE